MTLVSFNDYSFSYSVGSDAALTGINLAIEEREGVVVSGLSGSGKSTLCLAAAGLLASFPAGKSSGEISWCKDGSEGRSVTSVVLQNFYSQISYLRSSVIEEIAFPCENLGLSREETARRVEEAIGKIRIGHLAYRKPLELSGGEKQKVVLAAAIAVKPRLLILDEPLSQLDPETTFYLADVLKALKGEMSVLVAENNPYLTLKVADRLVILSEGKVIADGRPADVIDSHTVGHIELPAWTECVAGGIREGIVQHYEAASPFELNYRRALSILRGHV